MGRLRQWPRLGLHLCAVHSVPGPCGQSGFLQVQVVSAQAAQPPSRLRPRGPLTQGRGARAVRLVLGTLLPDAPHTHRGHASAARAPHPLTRHLEGKAAGQGAHAGSSRAGTAHQASPGHPQLAGDWAAVMTGCAHTCVSVLQLTWAHSSPEPPRADQPAPPHHSPLPCSHGPLVLKPLGEHEVGCCGQGRATRRLCP